MKYYWLTLFLIQFYLSPSGKVFAQNEDTLSSNSGAPVKKVKNPGPRNATIRSAIIPGWGQIYNGKKSYWKVPIIYAAGATIT